MKRTDANHVAVEIIEVTEATLIEQLHDQVRLC